MYGCKKNVRIPERFFDNHYISLQRPNDNHLRMRPAAVITLEARWIQQNILRFGLVYTNILPISYFKISSSFWKTEKKVPKVLES